ncbi:hypothetical protein HOI71_29490 [Candidatus Poribacteria bacterium]|nr:hypothetical protein [Candidatus Poribacteria bacterium]
MRRRAWTDEDDEHLRRHHERMENHALAKALKRSENAVARRLSALGLRRAYRWTAQADALLIARYNGLTNAELARELGATDAVIAHRLRALGLRRGSDE